MPTDAPIDRSGPIDRIESFVRGEPDLDFDRLVAEAFAFQLEHLPAYARLCERRGVDAASISSWRDVPPTPTLAFKTLELSTEPALETFRSSGTTSESRSVHHHPYPDLYRTTIDVAFPGAALPPMAPGARVPMLSLVPSREQVPDSSLGFMVDHVMRRWADDGGVYAIGTRGVDGRTLRTWLAGRQRDGRPVLILATALALLEMLDTLDRLGLRFRLPPGSLVFETGGYKGERVEARPEQIEQRLLQALGLPTAGIVREYGMTELTSQLYSRPGADQGGPPRFYPPPWVRVHTLSPQTLEPLGEGETGMVAVFDLANVGSALHVLTEDIGSVEQGALVLRGRAGDAELRGCSLTTEELIGG